MKLFFDPASTTSRVVTFFLHDQNIPFSEVIVPLAEDGRHVPELQKYNPSGQVPVLVDDDGFALTESSAILRYVALKHGLATYPGEPRMRARIDETISWFQTNFHVYHCVLGGYTYILPMLSQLDAGTLATMRAIGSRGGGKYLTILNDVMLRDMPYVCGGRITLADYVGAAIVTLGYHAGMDLSSYPNVARWLETLRGRRGWAPAYSAFEAGLAVAGKRAA